MKIAQQIAMNSPLAVSGTKTMINYAVEHTVAESLTYMATWQAGMFQMEDVFLCVWALKGRRSLPMFTLTPALHYRDRYEGQLNEFLLENKNLKEQLTTLQVVWLAIKSWTSNFTLKSQSQFEIQSQQLSGGGGPACGGKGRGSWSPLLSFSSLLWLLLLLLLL